MTASFEFLDSTPCSAQVIYADMYVEIIAVFDFNGNMINSYMVMRTVQR